MILPNMTPKNINFGETEGKHEFNSDENIENMFFIDEYKDYVQKFIDGKLRYIYGLKGTGKTSLLKFLENVSSKKSAQTIFISYREFKEEADVIHSFKTELKETDDKDTYALTFWRWYLLSLISKACLNETKYDPSKLIYQSKVIFFRVLSSVLDLVTEINVGNKTIKLGGHGDNPIKTYVKWEGQTAERIRDLENSIKTFLDKKTIIFIDELELSKFSSTFDIDAILIKNLIRATRKINEINKNLHIILAVRSEVVNSIATAGDEINKELEDFGFEIEWHRRKFDIEHPIISMFIKKIRFSMLSYIRENTLLNHTDIIEIQKMTNSEIWNRWFPEKLSNYSSPEFILQNTWLRPRDLSRLFKAMQKYAKGNMFTQTSFDEAIKKVGEDSWKEIEEELSSIYTSQKMTKIRTILETVQILFMPEQFIELCKNENIERDEAKNILLDLYRLSAIGNHYKTIKHHKVQTMYRFFYRNDRYLEFSKAIIVHKVIEKGLGLNYFNEKLLTEHFTSEEKEKYLQPITSKYDSFTGADSIRFI